MVGGSSSSSSSSSSRSSSSSSSSSSVAEQQQQQQQEEEESSSSSSSSGSSSSSHGVHTKLGPTWRCQSAQSREVFGMGVAASEGAWMGIASGKRCGGPVYF